MAAGTLDTNSPVHAARGTRSRAGNAMGRTREAALSGASAAIVKYGSRKATMGDIAMLAGIAKATLYNHFRTRDDVYLALVHAEVDTLASTVALASAGNFADDVAEAARLIGVHPVVRRLARDEAAVLASIAIAGEGDGWNAARAHVGDALARSALPVSPAAVDLVLRYLVTQLFTPSDDVQAAAIAELLTLALHAVPTPVSLADPAVPPADTADTSS